MNNSRLETIYNGLVDIGVELDPFEVWEPSIRLLYKCGKGGVVFHALADNPAIWYVNIFCPGSMPPLLRLRTLLFYAKYSGCNIVAAVVTNSIIVYLLKRMGFNELRTGLWSIRLS